MSKEDGVTTQELGVETTKPREPIVRQLTEVYNRYNNHHIQFFSEEAPTFDSRIRASLFVKQLYATIRFELGALELDEQDVVETTPEIIRQLYEAEIKGDDELCAPLELEHIVGEAKRQYALVAKQIEIQRDSGIGEFIRGARADEPGLATYNTIVGLVEQAIHPDTLRDVGPTTEAT